MTHYTLADLEMADRHIAEGQGHVVRQEVLLTGLRTRGEPAASAEALLAVFNATVIEYRVHRAAIAQALQEASESVAAGRLPTG